MDNRFHSEMPSSRFPLVLYGAAIAIALGAAAVASTVALTPRDAAQPVLVVSGTQVTGPDRIAGMIEPTAPIRAAAVQPAKDAPIAETSKPVAIDRLEKLAALPPKPLRRPCIECAAPLAAPAPTVEPAAQAAADPAPAEAEYDVADVSAIGPVPPLPIGSATGEGARHGFLRRSGEAVVSGGSEIVGTAWTLSGAAVGGLVRGVRDLTF
ncbi:hypothetical protein LB518_16055 [Mesorhizobium sp. BR1-1-16]|uniref:hypothetical protein n=1 Tax=Mesorhizobium sp. BR1-1-16 TaxID=2876653 RepID=UPI001CCFB667|nr:hypothetical protein [Mesorhizobium sp. BR1-1-16]MBZ9937814.1 hypothetical protein [Mesorhizobium sp. BR1-1-16]